MARTTSCYPDSAFEPVDFGEARGNEHPRLVEMLWHHVAGFG